MYRKCTRFSKTAFCTVREMYKRKCFTEFYTVQKMYTFYKYLPYHTKIKCAQREKSTSIKGEENEGKSGAIFRTVSSLFSGKETRGAAQAARGERKAPPPTRRGRVQVSPIKHD